VDGGTASAGVDADRATPVGKLADRGAFTTWTPSGAGGTEIDDAPAAGKLATAMAARIMTNGTVRTQRGSPAAPTQSMGAAGEDSGKNLYKTST
jgi:hypothetical protein